MRVIIHLVRVASKLYFKIHPKWCRMDSHMTNIQALKIQQACELRLLKMKQAMDLAELERSPQGEEMVDPKVAALITQFDDATNAIAARIQALINAGGLSAESEAALQGEVDKLKLLGHDPTNPTPGN